MAIFLDHIFIISKLDAPEAKRLAGIGLVEGGSNTHPGQGTSNRRFFLDGLTIELLFVSDSIEAASGAGKRLGILNRSKDTEASPFGIVVRVTDAEATPDFPSWQYFPDYFPSHMCFYVGKNSDKLEEPLCICMPPSLPMSKSVPDQYANPDWRFTELKLQVPVSELSATLSQFASIDNVSIQTGKSHKMTLVFNDGVAEKSVDLMPELPLVVEW